MKNYRDPRLLEMLDHIDPKYIEKTKKYYKSVPAKGAHNAKIDPKRQIKYIVALVACLALLSAFIPIVTYIIQNHLNISGFHETTGGETTLAPEITSENITTSPEPESSAPETTETEPENETTEAPYDGTTADPEPEYDGSRGLVYKLADDGKSAWLYAMGTCTDEDIVVASYYNGVPVTMIGEVSLADHIRVKSVTLPDTVTAIDMRAFKNCTGLEKVTIPDGVSFIGADAFENCKLLKSITLPARLEKLETTLFMNCIGLESVVIPAGVKSISSQVFRECTALRELDYLGTVKEWNAVAKDEDWDLGSAIKVVHCSDGDVEANEYDGSRGLEYKISDDGTYAILVGIGTCTDKNIVVATTYNGVPVKRIDSHAFSGCASLTEIVIPEGVTIIHDEAFYLCKNLKKVTLPSTLEWIQYWAFAGCDSLERITIPDSVTQISIRAFSDCKNLSSLTLGAGVELIEESAFQNCTALGYVRFPKSLRLLANDAFAGCSSLTNIYYAGTIQEWNSVDSTGRDYGNNYIWYEGVPTERITCTNGYIFISPISENEAYEAARVFLGIDKSQIGGKYQFATKAKDPSRLDCYRVALCEYIPDIGYMGEYEVLREVYVNQNTGECTEIVFDYPDIPEVFLDVIFNREKFIYVDQDYSNGEYTYKTEETYLKTFKISGEWLFGKDPQDYSILDLDGDSFPELIFRNVPRNIPGLILRYYDGKVYGYTWGGDGLMTDGTNPWHEGAGSVQVLDIIYFDGLLFRSREIMRYDFSDPKNVKYYVEGKETTKEEYDKFAAKYDGEYLKYSNLDLYPVYVNPFPGG